MTVVLLGLDFTASGEMVNIGASRYCGWRQFHHIGNIIGSYYNVIKKLRNVNNNSNLK